MQVLSLTSPRAALRALYLGYVILGRCSVAGAVPLRRGIC